MFSQYLMNHLSKLKKQGKGFTLVELAGMSILLVIIAVLGVDMGILIFASDACDKACKDCARAAGTGRTPGQAIDAMNAALTTHISGLGPMMSALSAQLMVYEDYSTGTPSTTSGGANGPWETTTGSVLPGTTSTGGMGTGGTIPGATTPTTVWFSNTSSETCFTPGPYVVVRCTMTATVPAPIFFFGSSITPNQVQVASCYTYPLINTFATVVAAQSPTLPNPNLADANASNNTSTSTNASTTSSTTGTTTDSASTTNANSTSTNGNSTSNNSNSTSNNSTSTDQGSGTSSSSSSISNSNSTSTTTNSSSTSISSNTNSTGTTSNSSSTSNSSNTNSTGTSSNSNSTSTHTSSNSTTGGGGNGNGNDNGGNNTSTTTATTGSPSNIMGANDTGGPHG